MGVKPVRKYALFRCAELSCSGQNTAAVNPHREIEGMAIFPGHCFRRQLGCPVERNGLARGKCLVDAFLRCAEGITPFVKSR